VSLLTLLFDDDEMPTEFADDAAAGESVYVAGTARFESAVLARAYVGGLGRQAPGTPYHFADVAGGDHYLLGGDGTEGLFVDQAAAAETLAGRLYARLADEAGAAERLRSRVAGRPPALESGTYRR
jgi:hypothetical protein